MKNHELHPFKVYPFTLKVEQFLVRRLLLILNRNCLKCLPVSGLFKAVLAQQVVSHGYILSVLEHKAVLQKGKQG